MACTIDYPRLFFSILLAFILLRCGGGGGGVSASAPPPAFHSVTISWTANREKGVNSPGGGYQVMISGQSTPINVPYVSGATAPATTITSLYTGNYTATVRAYAALDATGSTTGAGNLSAPSSVINIVVP